VICLLVVTDGRKDCIEQTIPSALENLNGPITRRVIYDDSGDHVHRAWLAHTFPSFELVWHPCGRQGFGGAIRTAWSYLFAADERFVFHLEDDFTFNRPVDLSGMVHVLDRHPHLVQLALRRQPWNPQERAAGGIVEQWPDTYKDRQDSDGHAWLEHRNFFTTNPSLYRRSLCGMRWPEGGESEGRFGLSILDDPLAQFGYWGARDSGEAVTHIGHERVGSGY
jgi:hypothetical protein